MGAGRRRLVQKAVSGPGTCWAASSAGHSRPRAHAASPRARGWLPLAVVVSLSSCSGQSLIVLLPATQHSSRGEPGHTDRHWPGSRCRTAAAQSTHQATLPAAPEHQLHKLAAEQGAHPCVRRAWAPGSCAALCCGGAAACCCCRWTSTCHDGALRLKAAWRRQHPASTTRRVGSWCALPAAAGSPRLCWPSCMQSAWQDEAAQRCTSDWPAAAAHMLALHVGAPGQHCCRRPRSASCRRRLRRPSQGAWRGGQRRHRPGPTGAPAGQGSCWPWAARQWQRNMH